MSHLWTPWRMPYLRGEGQTNNNGCIFCNKVRGEDDIKEHVLHRGERCFVTLNLYPYNNGHVMVAPNGHIAAFDELDEATLLELAVLTQRCLRMLRAAYSPQGFNVGINLGQIAGAGVADHLHQHIVPRWSGDTNFMTVAGQTRVIPEWVDETYALLKPIWDSLPVELGGPDQSGE